MPFVLTIEPYRDSWKCEFEIEAAKIRSALGETVVMLHHIGSTAIPRIYAKPIIDILAEVTSLEAIDARVIDMQALGYDAMGEFGIPGRRYFRKDDSNGSHVHAFAHQSPQITRHLTFRNYLISHPGAAQTYSDLKRRLMETCKGNIDAYVDGKDAFVKEVERKALDWATKRV
ncbi:MAG TPA: GrpB family protein [Verrucomicrobiae bacterium]|nr:GrpB family protein [Verrucomicrobiae bacterium]